MADEPVYLAQLAHFLRSRVRRNETLPRVFELEGARGAAPEIETINGRVQFESEVNNFDHDPPEHAFFVDEDPDANWEHPCSYVLVHRSGAISHAEDTAPPSSQSNAVMHELDVQKLLSTR